MEEEVCQEDLLEFQDPLKVPLFQTLEEMKLAKDRETHRINQEEEEYKSWTSIR